MFAFIKNHWLVYIIGTAIAVLIGLGASYFLGVKWSTPADVRKERIAAEQQDHVAVDDMANLMDKGSSIDSADPN